MLKVDVHTMEIAGAKLESVEHELEGLERMLIAFEVHYEGHGLPASVTEAFNECRKLRQACRDQAEELKKSLQSDRARFEELEDSLVRTIEQTLGRAMEGLVLDRALSSRCAAYGVQGELRALSLGGVVATDTLPGVVSLEFPAQLLQESPAAEADHGV